MSTPTINMTVEEQKVLLAKFMAEKEKTKQRSKEYREKNKEKCDEWSLRARVRASIMVAKAKAKGITVSDAEIDEYISNM